MGKEEFQFKMGYTFITILKGKAICGIRAFRPRSFQIEGKVIAFAERSVGRG